MNKKDKKQFLVGLILMLTLIAAWTFALRGTPTDAAMGDVYRVIYLHVPSAITCFAVAYILLFASIMSLRKKKEHYLYLGRASAEVGLLFTVLTLATGSIWGYPTWGVWWTWDARITTTFLLALLYAGYMLLYDSLPSGPRKGTACAALGIFIALDVPVIYKSVTWWRTLHQPPSILREGGSTMEPIMLKALGLGFAALLLVALWMIYQRVVNLSLATKIEQSSFDKMES
jgi:heme exporter protein C